MVVVYLDTFWWFNNKNLSSLCNIKITPNVYYWFASISISNELGKRCNCFCVRDVIGIVSKCQKGLFTRSISWCYTLLGVVLKSVRSRISIQSSPIKSEAHLKNIARENNLNYNMAKNLNFYMTTDWVRNNLPNALQILQYVSDNYKLRDRCMNEYSVYVYNAASNVIHMATYQRRNNTYTYPNTLYMSTALLKTQKTSKWLCECVC